MSTPSTSGSGEDPTPSHQDPVPPGVDPVPPRDDLAPGRTDRGRLPGRPGDRLPSGPAGVPSTPARGPDPSGTAWSTTTVATFPDYIGAQRAVDYLADNQFPVNRVAIVGTDLRLVEHVLARLTTGRAALAGVASGAWIGLLIGLLFGIFSVSAWWRVLVAAVLIGAAWGAIFGAIAHAATGGRRDFSSRSSLQAAQYAVTVDSDLADQARQLLTRLTWRTGGPGAAAP